MGWTFTSKGRESVREFFEKQWNRETPELSQKILACYATWTTAYMAFEIKTPEKREVVGVVCQLRHVPRAKDGYNFGYKDMDETVGPCEFRCPATILALLTPTTHEYALDWRKRCQERIDKRAKAPSVKAGDWVKFASPITFRGGETLDTLQWVKGSTFKRYYGLYRISNWRENEYQNIGAVAPAA